MSKLKAVTLSKMGHFVLLGFLLISLFILMLNLCGIGFMIPSSSFKCAAVRRRDELIEEEEGHLLLVVGPIRPPLCPLLSVGAPPFALHLPLQLMQTSLHAR